MNAEFQVSDKVNVIGTNGKAIPATVTGVYEQDGKTFVAVEYDPAHPIYKVVKTAVIMIPSRTTRLELVERPQAQVVEVAEAQTRREAIEAFVDTNLRPELSDYRERVIVDIDDWFEHFADNWNAEAIELIGMGSIHEAERHAEAIVASGGDMEAARWMLS